MLHPRTRPPAPFFPPREVAHTVVQGGGGADVIQRRPSDNQSDTEAQRAIRRIRAYRKRRRDTNSDPGIEKAAERHRARQGERHRDIGWMGTQQKCLLSRDASEHGEKSLG